MYSNQDPLPLLFPPSSSQLRETETPLHTGTDMNIGLSLPSSSLAFIPRGRTSAFLIPPPRKHCRGQVQAQSLRRTGFLPPRGSASGTVLLRTLEPQESLLGLWHEGSTRGEASQGDLGRLPTPDTEHSASKVECHTGTSTSEPMGQNREFQAFPKETDFHLQQEMKRLRPQVTLKNSRSCDEKATDI